MRAPLDWARDGRDWPHADASRFVQAAGQGWHVQVLGRGPTLLLLHGTAASTHSFRDLAPLLAERFTVVMPDLPGHAFTERPRRDGLTLPGMARGVGALVEALGLRPSLAVGHSAGAAVLARMAIDRAVAPARLVALNGALLPFDGHMGQVAPALARLLALNPLVPRAFAALTGEAAVGRLLAGMGSRLDPRGVAFYARLLGTPAHVEGALAMMSAWDLAGLARDLPGLPVPLTLVHGRRDRAVPEAALVAVRRRLPGTDWHLLSNLGHLAHEEDPRRVADLLLAIAAQDGLLTPAPAAPGSAATPTG